MSVTSVIMALAGIVLVGAILKPFSILVGIPRSGLLVLLGFVCSEIITGAGYDTGLRWYQFRDIVFYGIIPLLVFNTAFQLELDVLRKNLAAVLVFALPIRVLSALLIAVCLFFGINHSSGFPFLVALLLGGILTATDPDNLIERLNLHENNTRLCVILRAESLLNDVVAIMFFSLLLTLILMTGELPSLGAIVAQFLWISIGGVIFGVLAAKISTWVLRFTNHEASKNTLLLANAYLVFIVADKFLAISGVAATLVFGLMISRIKSEKLSVPLFATLAEILSVLLFFIAGMTVTLALFSDRWRAILLAIFATLSARFISAYIFSAAVYLSGNQVHRVSKHERSILGASGTPGAVALALALSLPVELPGWYTVQAAVYGVVVFSMFLQTPIWGARISRLESVK